MYMHFVQLAVCKYMIARGPYNYMLNVSLVPMQSCHEVTCPPKCLPGASYFELNRPPFKVNCPHSQLHPRHRILITAPGAQCCVTKHKEPRRSKAAWRPKRLRLLLCIQVLFESSERYPVCLACAVTLWYPPFKAPPILITPRQFQLHLLNLSPSNQIHFLHAETRRPEIRAKNNYCRTT